MPTLLSSVLPHDVVTLDGVDMANFEPLQVIIVSRSYQILLSTKLCLESIHPQVILVDLSQLVYVYFMVLMMINILFAPSCC